MRRMNEDLESQHVKIVLSEQQINYLKKIFSRPDYVASDSIQEIMYMEGMQRVVNYLEEQSKTGGSYGEF